MNCSRTRTPVASQEMNPAVPPRAGLQAGTLPAQRGTLPCAASDTRAQTPFLPPSHKRKQQQRKKKKRSEDSESLFFSEASQQSQRSLLAAGETKQKAQRPPPPRAHSCSTRSPSRPARPLSAVTRRGGAVPPALSSRPAPRTSASLTPPTRHSSRWHFLLPGPGVGKGGPALSRPASAQSRGCRHAPDVAG